MKIRVTVTAEYEYNECQCQRYFKSLDPKVILEKEREIFDGDAVIHVIDGLPLKVKFEEVKPEPERPKIAPPATNWWKAKV